MNNSPLRDRTILVTRPGGLSDHLRDNISAAGGKAIHLPSMAIVPVAESSAAKQLLTSVADFDVLIFVSRNAVKYANELMPGISDKAKDKTVFAVGTGTYEELEGVGFSDVSYTDSNTGSDALLDMEELQAENVADKKIIIVRGVGGRELLGDKLVARGAELQYAELYRRAMPELEPAIMKNIWLSEKPDVVLVTSVEGLRNLLEMTGEEERPIFLNTRLVVISHRLKGAADSLGFCATVKVATGYSDDDFLVALTELFEANGNGR
jgi:uroporphyrinogen-III synthase